MRKVFYFTLFLLSAGLVVFSVFQWWLLGHNLGKFSSDPQGSGFFIFTFILGLALAGNFLFLWKTCNVKSDDESPESRPNP